VVVGKVRVLLANNSTNVLFWEGETKSHANYINPVGRNALFLGTPPFVPGGIRIFCGLHPTDLPACPGLSLRFPPIIERSFVK